MSEPENHWEHDPDTIDVVFECRCGNECEFAIDVNSDGEIHDKDDLLYNQCPVCKCEMWQKKE